MTLYSVVKTLHIICSTILFGASIGNAFQMVYGYLISSKRGQDVSIMSSVTRGVVMAGWCMTTPTAILQPLTGYWLIYLMGYPWNSHWLILTYIMYAIALLCWFPVIWIQCEMASLAKEAKEQNMRLPYRFHKLFRTWFSLGWPALIAFTYIYYLMTTKPM